MTGTSAALSAAATDDGGASNLTYTWSATTVPAGAATPMFGVNGTNAASNTTATFSQAGNYAFLVTVSDGQGGSNTSSVSVTVNQTLTGIQLSSSTVASGATVQATALDQFGNPQISHWSATGGSIDPDGLFTAGVVGGPFMITATFGTSSVNAGVTVVPTSYSGTAGNDTYAIRLSPSDATLEQIFVDTPETGTPTYVIPINQLSTLSFTPASDGSVTVDFANGNPLPSNGITYSGGNSLVIDGAPTGAMAFTIDGAHVIDSAASSSPIVYSNLQSVTFNLAGGSNSLTQTAQPGAAVTYNAGPLSNTLTVNGGSFTISSDPQIASGNLTVNDNSAVVFSPPVAGTGYNARNVYALNIGSGGTAALTASMTATDRTVLATSQLSIAAGGTRDLGNNAMIVHNGNLASITGLVATGLNAAAGYWNGTGITSSAARNDTTFLTAVGAISNNIGGTALYTTFDNQPVGLNDVLIKYTYVGDTNLDGVVDGSDYSRIDNAFLTPVTGWFNGDFNYDGAIDGSDYTLIDNAFNTQGAVLAARIAAPTAQIASPTAGTASVPSAKKVSAGVPTSAARIFQTQTPITFSQSLQDSIETSLRKKDVWLRFGNT